MNDNTESIESLQESFGVTHFDTREYLSVPSVQGLNILYLNVNSLRNKKLDVESYLCSLGKLIHIILLTETRIHAEETKFFNIQSYDAWFNCRSCRNETRCADLSRCRHKEVA